MRDENDLSLPELTRLGGFMIPIRRFQLVLPQIEWIMKESELLDSIALAGNEPANIYFPLAHFPDKERGENEA